MKYFIGITSLIGSGVLNTYLIYGDRTKWKAKYYLLALLVFLDIVLLVMGLMLLTSK